MRRRSSLILVTIAVAVIAPSAALSAAERPQAMPLLGDGSHLGSEFDKRGHTQAYEGTAPCGAADGRARARVFDTGAAGRRLLELTVRDAPDDGSICAASIFRADTDVLDEASRADGLVDQTTACGGASCALSTWLDASRSYLVVVWGTGPDRVDFVYDARIRRPIDIDVRLRGHRMTDCHWYREVIRNRRFTVSASAPVTGMVRFYLDAKTTDGWKRIAKFDRPLRDGTASWTHEGGRAGKRRVKVRFFGDATTLAAVSGYEKIRYVEPSWRRYADGGARLFVRYHRQQYRLSCEAATIRMAVNFWQPGRFSSDRWITERYIGIDPRRPDVRGGCDPDRAFCGNLNGRMMVDGYGAHYRPVEAAIRATSPCRTPVAISPDGFSSGRVARYVDKGFPVIVWLAHRGASGIYRHEWRAWTGNDVVGYSVEHVWVVIGFRGPVDDPDAFIVHDPSKGDRITMSRGAFYRATRYFKTGVVVRG